MFAATSDIAANVAAVRARIAAATKRAGRPTDSVRLLAVTKMQPAARVAAVVAAGVSDLGENYVQEARDKIPLVPFAPTWHLVGHLQRNKANISVELFSLIHSVDKYQLAQELGKHASKKGETQNVLVEVNLVGDPTRPGVTSEGALALAEQVAGTPGLNLHGMMGMAPFDPDPELARPYFARLRALWEQLPEVNRQTLSMGMSGDFEVAVEEGATLVRIGTALFGARTKG